MNTPIYRMYRPSAGEVVLICLNYVACIPTLLAVGALSLYHFWCIGCNTSTIESWEKDKVSTLIRRGKIREVKYPYDLGFFKNISSVLGPSMLMWCIPQDAPGNGLSYQVQEGTGRHHKDDDDDDVYEVV